MALLNPPILTHFNHPHLHSHGCIKLLVQTINGEEKVVSYISRNLTKSELNYSTTEKECLAMVWAIYKLRPYLYEQRKDMSPLPESTDQLPSVFKPIPPASCPLKALTTIQGRVRQKLFQMPQQWKLYEFLKIPFGLCTSPNVFQRYVYNVLRDLLKDKTLVLYMDDIIIPAQNELELNLKKCHFLKIKIEFLGHENKLTLIWQDGGSKMFPQPRTTKEEEFSRPDQIFWKFIPQYSKPLSDLNTR
ncbi:hypothetical protein LAZ67_10001038 [Cordylochernes scorpioides]|uniref:Uncharacterized protein n=1 Tax=Cordylochernes scorpioides TaxID=51811 RepID=A0ABY6KVH4_9ARAC|nr:hypothetical protein LAZ67_10001038 [Cordylochernes scorpioides]